MQLTRGPQEEDLRSGAGRHTPLISYAVLLAAFCVVVRFGEALIWPPALLFGCCVLVSSQAGRTAGLIASVFSALLLGALHPGTASVRGSLGFLLLGSATAWLTARIQDRWRTLERERDEMRIMLDHAPIGVALFDINRKVLRCNPAFRDIYGFHGEEIVGSIPPLPDSQRESWADLVEQLRAGKSFVSIETVRAQKDGTQFYARISGSPVFDRTVSLVGLVGFIAKVDDGGYSELLELRNLESLVQRSSDFMCVTHLDRRTFFLNDAGKDLIGLPRDNEMDAVPFEDLFVDADRAHVAEILQELPTKRLEITAQTVHLTHLQTAQPVAVSCSFFVITDPLTKEDSSFACVAKAVDEEAEYREEVLQPLSEVPVAIVLVDATGVPFRSNALFQEMLGYDAKDLQQVKFSQLVHSDDVVEGCKQFLSLITGDIDYYQTDKRLQTRGGDILLTKITVALMRDRSGRPSYGFNIVESLDQG
jgi:PAS domain S-box-containing protein